MQGEVVYGDGKVVIARGGIPRALTVCGALDSRNADPVVNALKQELRTAYKRRTGSHLYLDVSRLEFEETCAIKALVSVAGAAGDGQRLVLTGIDPAIRRVLVLVGWADLPGLVIASDALDGPEALPRID